MGKRTAVSLLLVGALLLGGLVLTVPSGNGQQPAPPRTVDEKLNDILARLEKIEKRLAEVAPQPLAPRAKARARDEAFFAPANANAGAAVATELPCGLEKQKPRSSTFNGCQSHGDDKGDSELNFLKNRIDDVDEWIPVTFDAVLKHPFPKSVGGVDRGNWDAADLAEVKKCEGLPISIVCYITDAKQEDVESCNCHIADPAMYDIHIWLTKEPAKSIDGKRDRRQAVVAEVTPRLKVKHPEWNVTNLRRLARDGTQVRVSGWLLLDQEHPDQLKAHPPKRPQATRGTLWEIHPIMEIEVLEGNRWVPLDDLHS